MKDFERLKQDYYHRVAIGPFEMPTQVLLGSDIVLHLPVLEYYASLCKHVTEFGVRDGHSTVALASGCKGHLVSYDIQRTGFVHLFEKMVLPCRWTFIQMNTIHPKLVIDETDFLFIDTLHTYEQVRTELAMHGRKARKFLGFHDTFTCGEKDLSGPNPNARGILPAIEEFLASYPDEYRVAYDTKVNNGMRIYERLS